MNCHTDKPKFVQQIYGRLGLLYTDPLDYHVIQRRDNGQIFVEGLSRMAKSSAHQITIEDWIWDFDPEVLQEFCPKLFRYLNNEFPYTEGRLIKTVEFFEAKLATKIFLIKEAEERLKRDQKKYTNCYNADPDSLDTAKAMLSLDRSKRRLEKLNTVSYYNKKLEEVQGSLTEARKRLEDFRRGQVEHFKAMRVLNIQTVKQGNRIEFVRIENE
jgi:hypothetical protein